MPSPKGTQDAPDGLSEKQSADGGLSAVVARWPAVVTSGGGAVAHQVPPLRHWDGREELLPLVREDELGAATGLVVPIDL